MASYKGVMAKSYYRAKCVDISKTVGDTYNGTKLLLMTNRKLHYVRSIGTKIDDLELLLWSNFERGFS